MTSGRCCTSAKSASKKQVRALIALAIANKIRSIFGEIEDEGEGVGFSEL
jgi:hypothetical protein